MQGETTVIILCKGSLGTSILESGRKFGDKWS